MKKIWEVQFKVDGIDYYTTRLDGNTSPKDVQAHIEQQQELDEDMTATVELVRDFTLNEMTVIGNIQAMRKIISNTAKPLDKQSDLYWKPLDELLVIQNRLVPEYNLNV